jgi:hypothetical protein
MDIDLFKPADTLKLILLIISVQLIISSLEGLYNYKIYKPGQLLGWRNIKQSKKIFRANPFIERVFDLLFNYPNSLFLIFSRLVLTGLMIYLIIAKKSFNTEIILIAVLTILIGLRDTYSNNGADQLTGIILIAISFTALRPGSVVVQYAAIIFIAFQAILSYLTSGAYKLINEGWRNGNNLQAILSTEVFGNLYVKRIMDNLPNSYIIGSFLIMFGELFLGICFLFPPQLCLLVLFTGVLFHLSVAVVMGLNTFLWTFGSTYPAIYFISQHYFNCITNV